jgi:EAL domain-containing protein (putative c-di-GMP-specific phosphodiesterase class I)
MQSRATLLDKILEPGTLQVMCLPAYRLVKGGKCLHSVEFLIRGPQGTNLEKPWVLFEYARQKQAEMVLDRACLCLHLEAASRVSGDFLISVNVQAVTISRDSEFPEWIESVADISSIPLHRIILEIADHASVWDRSNFVASITALQKKGVRIALDNFGSRSSGWQFLLHCQPDLFKIDSSIIHGIATDPRRQLVLESIAFLTKRAGAIPIACGIDNHEDLEFIKHAGIEVGQGFLFSELLTTDEMAGSYGVISELHEASLNC